MVRYAIHEQYDQYSIYQIGFKNLCIAPIPLNDVWKECGGEGFDSFPGFSRDEHEFVVMTVRLTFIRMLI